MNIYEALNIGELIKDNAYVGRGIVLGKSADGKKAVDILEGDTPEVLQKRVMEQAEWIILPLSVEKISKQIQSKRR